VLVSKEFEDYAEKNLVLVMLDFPNSKPQSDELKRRTRRWQRSMRLRVIRR